MLKVSSLISELIRPFGWTVKPPFLHNIVTSLVDEHYSDITTNVLHFFSLSIRGDTLYVQSGATQRLFLTSLLLIFAFQRTNTSAPSQWWLHGWRHGLLPHRHGYQYCARSLCYASAHTPISSFHMFKTACCSQSQVTANRGGARGRGRGWIGRFSWTA